MTPLIRKYQKEARIQRIRAVGGLTIAEGCRKVKAKMVFPARVA